jgi:choline transport protein
MPPQLPPETERLAEGLVSDDVATLEGFGYKQELKRSFGFFGMIGFAFSVLTCWTALAGSLTVAISAGGPPVIIYSWIGV